MADQLSMKEKLLEEYARLGPLSDPASRRRLEEVNKLLQKDARVNPAMRHAPPPKVCRVKRLRDGNTVVVNEKDFNATLHARMNGPAAAPEPVPEPVLADAVDPATDEDDDDLDDLDNDVLDELDKPPSKGRGRKKS